MLQNFPLGPLATAKWGRSGGIEIQRARNLAELEQFIGRPIKLQAEELYSQEQYDVVLI